MDNDDYIDTTYTIRRPGCSAWRQGVRCTELATELQYANDRVPGHIVVAESGPLEGEQVDPEAVHWAMSDEGMLS